MNRHHPWWLPAVTPVATALATVLALALALRPAPAAALAFGSAAVEVALGEGVAVARFPLACALCQLAAPPCAGSALDGCFAWRARGLGGFDAHGLARASMFAAARGGRVVAAVADGVLYTDDRGARWVRARWESPHAPLSVAFDPGSDFGAAVGTNGSLWTTEDRGATWTLRRDAVGRRLLDVVVLGRTVAFSDAAGGVWVSPDGGTRVRTLSDGARRAMPTMAVHDGAIWLRLEGAQWWRAAGAEVERVGE